ncbi:MAG: hypothetical protein WDW36_007518 [Sanguina aurantia]
MLLPPGYLPKLCCLMCEGLRRGNLPDCATQDTRGSTFAHTVVGLAAAMGRCYKAAKSAGAGAHVRELMLCPAVDQLARLAMVICSRPSTRSTGGAGARELTRQILGLLEL